MTNEVPHEKIYTMVGGEDTFTDLVNSFYNKVETDDILRPMYPKKLDMAKKKLKLFLIKKFGGPDHYTPLRGHPRMRRRHMKFNIGIQERNRWVEIMSNALDEVGINAKDPARETLQSYFEWMASHMINQTEFNLNQL